MSTLLASRRSSVGVAVGSVTVGGDAPIVVQSMTNTDTSDATATAAQVAAIWEALPTGDREGAVVLTGNYGQAGALEQLGPALGLPPVVSGHNSYWLWGPGPYRGGTLISVGLPRELPE